MTEGGTELKRSPLHEEHLLLGAQMVPFAGWEMPIQYAGIVEEHKAVRSSVGIFDVSHMATFRLCGLGAQDFLSRMLTNDITKIDQIGQAQYTLMLNEQGTIIDDVIVYRTGDFEFMIVANAANAQKDFAWLTAHLPEKDTADGELTLELVDESERTSLIAVQGPGAIKVITELAEEGFELPPRFSLAGALLDAVPVLIASTGYTGEEGVEIILPAVHARQVWRALLSFEEVSPIGLGARDTLRLEMGYSLYGHDIDDTTDPISAGLGWVVRKEGAYIGAEAVAKVRESGPAQKLVFLKLKEGSGVPRPGYTLLHNGDEVGKVASGSFSPVLGTGIATGYIPADLAKLGTEIQVQIRKKTATATIVKPPFIEK